MYEDLVKQFETLSDDEKNALLVYKSKLGIAINAMDNDFSKVRRIYNEYKELVDMPQNLFIKMSVFKDIDFSSEEIILDNDIYDFNYVDSANVPLMSHEIVKLKIINATINYNKTY